MVRSLHLRREWRAEDIIEAMGWEPEVDHHATQVILSRLTTKDHYLERIRTGVYRKKLAPMPEPQE